MLSRPRMVLRKKVRTEKVWRWKMLAGRPTLGPWKCPGKKKTCVLIVVFCGECGVWISCGRVPSARPQLILRRGGYAPSAPPPRRVTWILSNLDTLYFGSSRKLVFFLPYSATFGGRLGKSADHGNHETSALKWGTSFEIVVLPWLPTCLHVERTCKLP